MLEMNKVFLIGNLTRDPDCSLKVSGKSLAKLGLAVNRNFKNKITGEHQQETNFVDLEAWGKTADFAGQFLKKGTRVFVEGSLHFSSWVAKDGSKRSKLSVTVGRIQFVLPKAQEDGHATENAPRDSSAPPAPLPPLDATAAEIPF